MLYKSNTFDFGNLRTIQDLRASVLPSRWMAIQSLQFHWHVPDISQTAHREQIWYIWESGCRTIKTLSALRHFILALEGPWIAYNPEALQNLLKPLKDLRLKQPWEVRILRSRDSLQRDGLQAVDNALKAAGFDCSVTGIHILSPA